MRSRFIKWINNKPLGFQIFILISVSSFVFWHLLIGYELYSLGRREVERFQGIVSTQLTQFISDNASHIKLYDYERLRVNAIRLDFRYPAETLTDIF